MTPNTTPDPGAPDSAGPNYFTIISFCGGGFRGLMSAQILANVAAAVGVTVGGAGPINLVGNSTLLAGTSTGADIVGMLVSQNPAGRKTPAQLVTYFQQQEAPFFQHPVLSRLHPHLGMAAFLPNYSVDEVALGAVELHSTKDGWAGVPLVRDFTAQNLVFTSFQVGGPPGGANRNWGPVLFHNLPVPAGQPLQSPPEANIVDAVVASSAMPGMLGPYFPGVTGRAHPAPTDGTGGLIDGAFLAHDPTMAAVSLAVSCGVPLEQIAVLSIGAGLMPTYVANDTRYWGAAQWMGEDPKIDYQPVSPFLLGGNPSPLLSMALNGTTTLLAPNLAQLLLGERFYAISPVLDPPLTEANAGTAAQQELLNAANGIDLEAAAAFVRRYWQNPRQPPRLA